MAKAKPPKPRAATKAIQIVTPNVDVKTALNNIDKVLSVYQGDRTTIFSLEASLQLVRERTTGYAELAKEVRELRKKVVELEAAAEVDAPDAADAADAEVPDPPEEPEADPADDADPPEEPEEADPDAEPDAD